MTVTKVNKKLKILIFCFKLKGSFMHQNLSKKNDFFSIITDFWNGRSLKYTYRSMAIACVYPQMYFAIFHSSSSFCTNFCFFLYSHCILSWILNRSMYVHMITFSFFEEFKLLLQNWKLNERSCVNESSYVYILHAGCSLEFWIILVWMEYLLWVCWFCIMNGFNEIFNFYVTCIFILNFQS